MKDKSNLIRAEKIFKIALGDYYNMKEDGNYDEFISYSIDQSIINKWLVELWEHEEQILLTSFDNLSFEKLYKLTAKVNDFRYYIRFFQVMEQYIFNMDIVYQRNMLAFSSFLLECYSKSRDINREFIAHYKYKIYSIHSSIDFSKIKDNNESEYTNYSRTKDDIINNLKRDILFLDKRIRV